MITTKRPVPYDTLVIATGSIMRELRGLPIGTPHVHYLRTAAHARAIKADLGQGKRMVVIGAGLIGLEAAASAAEIGAEVTVIDIADRIMERVCDPETAAIVQAEHERHGVTFALSTSIIGSRPNDDGTIVLGTNNGGVHTADLVLVGIGVMPDDRIAASAALDVRDGIIVDAQCRTSDPRIFAAGDVARFETSSGTMRLENWRHAQGMVAPGETRPVHPTLIVPCRHFGASSTISTFKALDGRTSPRRKCGGRFRAKAFSCSALTMAWCPTRWASMSSVI